jgi:hypothetical protein
VISPFRRRMIEDMTVRNLSPATQQSLTRYRSSAGILAALLLSLVRAATSWFR